MAIDPGLWQRLEPLLDHALDLSDEERGQWLDNLREKSPELVEQLVQLLTAEEAADDGGFLNTGFQVPARELTLGPWELERPLGAGGMGAVWLARRTDGEGESRAAIKLLNLALQNAIGQARFRREGTMLARLAHPGIARLLDTGLSPTGQPYLVLEYIEGARIDRFADERALNHRDRIGLVLQVLSAIEHAHANQIVHRDIKPSNILVTSEGVAKLLDFGIAKMVSPGGSLGSAPLTAGSARVLTPEYAAPEQASGGAVSPATDVYAVGVLLYLLLSGKHPTAEGRRGAAEIITALFEVDPQPLGLGRIDGVLERSLRKKPEDRYQSAREMTDALGL
ncbi:MAG TPA: serine/threonine-protein kinase [Gemmatimonadales bacterium]|nr:serine/threonine-protein kinase [Gemmatimonadales bacterium]